MVLRDARNDRLLTVSVTAKGRDTALLHQGGLMPRRCGGIQGCGHRLTEGSKGAFKNVSPSVMAL